METKRFTFRLAPHRREGIEQSIQKGKAKNIADWLNRMIDEQLMRENFNFYKK